MESVCFFPTLRNEPPSAKHKIQYHLQIETRRLIHFLLFRWRKSSPIRMECNMAHHHRNPIDVQEPLWVMRFGAFFAVWCFLLYGDGVMVVRQYGSFSGFPFGPPGAPWFPVPFLALTFTMRVSPPHSSGTSPSPASSCERWVVPSLALPLGRPLPFTMCMGCT